VSLCATESEESVVWRRDPARGKVPDLVLPCAIENLGEVTGEEPADRGGERERVRARDRERGE